MYFKIVSQMLTFISAYVKFLKYPLCLHFLELLQHEEFRKEIVNGQVSQNCTECVTDFDSRREMIIFKSSYFQVILTF